MGRAGHQGLEIGIHDALKEGSLPERFATSGSAGVGYNRFVRFAWDAKKATLNERKQGVSFGEASTALRLATRQERRIYEEG